MDKTGEIIKNKQINSGLLMTIQILCLDDAIWVRYQGPESGTGQDRGTPYRLHSVLGTYYVSSHPILSYPDK